MNKIGILNHIKNIKNIDNRGVAITTIINTLYHNAGRGTTKLKLICSKGLVRHIKIIKGRSWDEIQFNHRRIFTKSFRYKYNSSYISLNAKDLILLCFIEDIKYERSNLY